jgi:hypothetical protein
MELSGLLHCKIRIRRKQNRNVNDFIIDFILST